MNDYFTYSSTVSEHTRASASDVDALGQAVETGLDKLPDEAVINEDRIGFGTDSGAADAYVVTLPQTVAYTAGLRVRFVAGAANTGASTVNVNSLGVKAIKQANGDALISGDIALDQVVDLTYDGTNFKFVGATNSAVTAAATSATNAATSETNAASSASSASTSATNASTSATNAATSETNAAASAARFETVVDLADGATPALDASLGAIFRLTAAGNRTIAVPTNPTAGQRIVIRHKASGGARTLALNSGAGGFRFGTDITALTETESGKVDYIGCIYDATDNKFDVVAYSKGY
jgi:hypothetical protein